MQREMEKREPEILGQTTGEAHKKRTYLHLAAENKWHRVVEWLLKAKVNVRMEQEDMDKKTAWDVAFEGNDGIVMSMFAMRHVARQVEYATAKNVKVRRHWFRTSDNDEKLSELPKKGDGGDSAFKLFTISKNKVGPS
jgi:CO dehydrogenase/acetyl-CoA synthase gamma subunit (corrinoid Fe-S protein)